MREDKGLLKFRMVLSSVGGNTANLVCVDSNSGKLCVADALLSCESEKWQKLVDRDVPTGTVLQLDRRRRFWNIARDAMQDSTKQRQDHQEKSLSQRIQDDPWKPGAVRISCLLLLTRPRKQSQTLMSNDSMHSSPYILVLTCDWLLWHFELLLNYIVGVYLVYMYGTNFIYLALRLTAKANVGGMGWLNHTLYAAGVMLLNYQLIHIQIFTDIPSGYSSKSCIVVLIAFLCILCGRSDSVPIRPGEQSVELHGSVVIVPPSN